MTVTELRPPEGDTYAEGLARAEKAQAEAEAARIRNEAERRRQQLAADKAEAKAQKEIARELEAAEDERRQREEQRRTEAAAKAKAKKSAETWRKSALAIAAVCVVVSLPLQVLAFWDPNAWFLVAAPLVLEGVAWALLKGAEAAIDDGRPPWHYRLGALLQALVAAGINFAHGSETYGIATGIGGALCSVIGPAIWDLHEHGRIAQREGRKTLAQRRTEKRAARAEKARVAKVNAMRRSSDEDVWERALYLAAALGELVPSEKTYRRAWDELHGAEVGSTAAIISAKRLARRSVRLAQNGPLDGLEKGENPQVDSQMGPDSDKPSKAASEPGEDGRKKNGGTPPVRRPGTTTYAPIARRQMSLEQLRPAQD
ncbi:hypothetical protein OG357_25645 [Streptomyces sp. NBC_01255]|uniref:hypothetical protein n=1 Tax=Streptomyces sp. NBC_01255 TaxID=2903798 RepID=UPI002E3230B9|nr:hypothetical protein [Streptomyces sp. NBC_01255]